jgi:uncharacterized protein YdaU (DUF1376 family)
MGRQPYMPLYVGDYIKDTRILPLTVRGFWLDIILFMWDNPVRGEIIGTIEEVARMVGCSIDEARFALNLLQQKKTAEIVLLDSGEFHIVSRRMKRDSEISRIRSKVGKNGVDAKKAKQFAEAKPKQIPEYEYEVENDIELKIKESFDEIYLNDQRLKWGHIDFDFEYRTFCEKVRGSPEHYQKHDGLRLALQAQLRYAKKKTNAKQTTTDLATSFANRVMQDAANGKFQGNQ